MVSNKRYTGATLMVEMISPLTYIILVLVVLAMWVYLVVHEENARQYDIFEYEKEILNQPRKRRR